MPSLTTPHFSFAIWTDGALAGDELRAALLNLGHTTVSAASNHEVPADILVIMERGTDFHLSHPGVWLRLANSARATIMVATTKGRTRESLIPVHATMTWTGEIRDLPEVAGSLVAIAPAVVESVPDLPHVFGVSGDAGIDACGREEDLELLLRLGRSRLVPVRAELIDRFQRISRASSRMQYLLSRLIDWSLQYRGRALVKQRLGVLGAGSNLGVVADRSLLQVLSDTRTTSLITLVGEPGAGKTQQMHLLDAQSALLAIQDQDAPTALETFYLPLFEHPAHTEISISWMVERWNTMVDPHGWCSLDEFIADGGVILMDGYNEVGSRAMRLEDWMLSWRAAVSQIFARGARRVVVSCRTRDQIIPLPSAHGEGITAVAVSPLSADEITALAAYTDADIAAELRRAIELDSDLLAFYASPFRLQTFLQSGASAIATTDARLFGASIVAAIMREREQLHFDSALLPDRAVVELLASCMSIHANPWPLLGELPLIRLLAALAKTLATRAGQSDWLAMSTIRRRDARRVLEAALATEGITSRNANDVIRTGRDLHIIVEHDAGELAFSHRIVQELFAALDLDTAESLELLATHPAVRHPLTRLGSMARSSASEPGFEGLAYALAEIKGEAFTESLADVNPLLAARAHAAARFDFRSAAGDTIRARLVDALLQTDMPPEESVAILRALALAGWSPPVLSPSTGAAGLHRIPDREWRLGAHIEIANINVEKTPSQLLSERRTIELPAFWISDCPVTVREYTDFISAGGYDRADLGP